MASGNLATTIQDAMGRLTAAEKRAARALIANYPTLALGPVAEFAAVAQTSPATVLRFIAQLGYESYPDFQRRLRDELAERIKSPLEKAAAGTIDGSRAEFLPRFAAQVIANIEETRAHLPNSEFTSVCEKIADRRAQCHLAGGRFTGPIAEYMAAHLRIVRPGVRLLSARATDRNDQLLDLKPNDVAIVFDIRRYDSEMLGLAKKLKYRRARIVLITDAWISPASRYADFVLPCAIDIAGAWDSSAAILCVVEAIIARVTELNWAEAEKRIEQNEAR